MDEQINQLKSQLEYKLGFEIKEANDLRLLQEQIHADTRLQIGYNTLRRFYGFLPGTKPSRNTLDTLSKYIGYNSFHSFINKFKFPNWEAWLKIISLKQKKILSDEDLNYLISINNMEMFSIYFNDIANHYFFQKNAEALDQIFRIELLDINRFDQLKMALSLGITLRFYYENDISFLYELIKNKVFREIVVYNFVDYSCFNKGYLKIITHSKKYEKDKNALLFLNSIEVLGKILKGDSVELKSQMEFYDDTFPIVKGRCFALSILTSHRKEQDVIFESMFDYSKNENKCNFYFEVIPALMLCKRVDLIKIIFDEFYEELFDINHFNRLTHLGLFQIAQSLISISEGNFQIATTELKMVKPEKAFHSYHDYIQLFLLISKFQIIENKKEAATVKKEYHLLSDKLGFRIFSEDLLENYFS